MRCLNVDWLTVYGICTSDREVNSCLPMYDIRINDRGTPHFAKWITVRTKDGYDIAQICYQPYSIKSEGGIFPKGAMTIQMCNRICYDVRLLDTLRLISDCVGFRYQCISRLDICLDLQKFDNGLTPKNLINGFYRCKYLKKGYAKAFGVGTQYTDYNPETLSFAGKGSAISVKLYNKTKEMNDEKIKPYIVDCWERCGMVKGDVWRLEFSIKSGGQDYVRIDTGEFVKLNIGLIENRDMLFDLYSSLVYNKFQFRKAVPGRRMTNLEKLRLIEVNEESIIKPVKVTSSRDYDRQAKIVSNALDKIRREGIVSSEEDFILFQAMCIMRREYRIINEHEYDYGKKNN